MTPPRSFWQMPSNTPDWMRPPDWMALGNPGKLVGMMLDPKTKKWVFVEAAAGLGEDPAMGQSLVPIVMLAGIAATCVWLWRRAT